MADYFPPGDKRRDKNLKDFHGKTPKEIKESRWYHGTVKDFKEFKPGRAQAIFLTRNPQFANEFASQGAVEHDWDDTNKIFIPRDGAQSKPNVMPVHVRAENPFDYQNKKHMSALIEKLGPQLISDPFLMDMMHEIGRGSWDAIESAPVQQAIKKMGHDSFYVNETGEKNLAVYNPAQIKSATGNRGTYDPNDPDITKAEGGSVDDDGITAYHGSPHDFDKFDISKVGTGEGAQSYGHGLYFAEQEPIAINYRDRLAKEGPSTGESIADYFAIDKGTHKFMSDEDIEEHLEDIGRQAVRTLFENKKLKFVFEDGSILTKEKDHFRAGQKEKGHMYEVNINAHPDHFIDWDRRVLEQPEIATKLFNGPDFIKNTAREEVKKNNDLTYGELHGRLSVKHPRGQQGLTEHLQEMGIPGIKYFDAGSRNAGEGSRNYVVFDDKLVTTKRKYARGGIVNA